MIAICREMTKLHEEIIRGSLKDVLESIETNKVVLRGEIVLVIAGSQKNQTDFSFNLKVKNEFLEREGEKLTFTPLMITALIKALKDFPLLNSSVAGDTIVQKRAINIGMAAAMADGNLIVPVIKNADHLNLVGLAKAVNDLAHRARTQQLKPEEVQEGTFTFTNIGNFGSLTGTPIINQPQVGIVAVGVIRKMPAVIETSQGDSIAIRKKMIISHSYDHRIINGAMGGQFIKSMADYLENWDINRSI